MAPTLDVATATAAFSVAANEKVHAEVEPGTTTYAVQPGPRLELTWEHVEDGFAVRDVPTGVFGVGPDLLAALDDAMAAAKEHLEVLERQHNLSPPLQAQLQYLADRIR